MKNSVIVFLILIISVLAGIFYLFFSGSSFVSEETDKLQVFVTIPPLTDLVDELVGEMADVSILVPPGASPHTYEPTPGQLQSIANADVLVKVGTPVEFEVVWLDKLVEVNPQLRVIDLSQGIPLREFEETDDHEEEEHDEDEEDHGGIDPHIWLSPNNLRIMARTLSAELKEILPEQGNLIEINAAELDLTLVNIDTQIRDLFSQTEIKKLLVYHDAWGYFADDYGLELVVAEELGKELTATALTQIIEIAKEENIRIIFGSPEFPTQSVQTIAQQIDGEVVTVSPLPEHILSALLEIAQSFSLTK